MKKSFAAIAATAMVALSANTFAATQGNVDNDASSGSIDITLNVNNAIVVKMLDDVILTVDGATPDAPIVGYEQICVGGIGFSGYSVNLSSLNAPSAGSFVLKDSSGTATMSYEAAFIDTATPGATGILATTGTGDIDPTTTYSPTADFQLVGDLACDSENAQLIVSIPEDEWQAATAASYSDTLTVLVAGQ